LPLDGERISGLDASGEWCRCWILERREVTQRMSNNAA